MSNEDIFATKSPINGGKTSLTLSLPEDVHLVLDYYKKEKHMLLGRFVDSVLDAYMKDENIVFALMKVQETRLYAKRPRFFNISQVQYDAARMLAQTTGMPIARIIARCITHAITELEADLPFGSTLGALLTKEDE